MAEHTDYESRWAIAPDAAALHGHGRAQRAIS